MHDCDRFTIEVNRESSDVFHSELGEVEAGEGGVGVEALQVVLRGHNVLAVPV